MSDSPEKVHQHIYSQCQVAATKTVFKIHQNNKEQLQKAPKYISDENSTLQESMKLLL